MNYNSPTSCAKQKLTTVPMKAVPAARRSMGTKMTPGGKAVTCTVCSWWAPILGQDITAAAKEFDAHVCSEHRPLKNIDKPSNAK
jgi:hypothetical protein